MRDDIEQLYLEETEFKLRPYLVRPELAQRPPMESLRVCIIDLLAPAQLAQLELLRRRICA